MLRLPDSWVWDLWLVDTGDAFHVFFLKASRALHQEHRRHQRASIGHAVSTDLRCWTVLPDALVHSDSPAFDDLATWTGSVVHDGDAGWRMFYTGVSREERGLVQRIGSATSEDLIVWHKDVDGGVLEADSRWYEKLDSGQWTDEAWRDPWVFADPDGAGWHMLITARANSGEPQDRGVIGHAYSPDLVSWDVRPPLSAPGGGFGQLEVPQVAEVDGRSVLIFQCLRGELTQARSVENPTGGIWSLPVSSATGPYDVGQATLLTDSGLYSGRLIQDRGGSWMLLAFHNANDETDFGGYLSDPIPVRWSGDRLTTSTPMP
jgi:beta-fructofuranosidase